MDDGYDLLYNSDIFRDLKEPEIFNKLSVDEFDQLQYYANNHDAAIAISPGDLYERQFNEYDGDTYVWRTKAIFMKIITTFDLFPDI